MLGIGRAVCSNGRESCRYTVLRYNGKQMGGRPVFEHGQLDSSRLSFPLYAMCSWWRGDHVCLGTASMSEMFVSLHKHLNSFRIVLRLSLLHPPRLARLSSPLRAKDVWKRTFGP